MSKLKVAGMDQVSMMIWTSTSTDGSQKCLKHWPANVNWWEDMFDLYIEDSSGWISLT